jgi:hypothetical protein
MDFQLTSGERVIWRGAPGQGLRLHAQDWFAIPFAVVWLGIILSVFIASPQDASGTDPAPYFILPFFLLIGVYILVGRFVIDMAARSRTEYALTNHRAIIESGVFRKSIRSVNLAAAPEIRLREGRGGRGTIEFSSGSPFAMVPRGWPGMSQYLPPAFDRIEDAASVYRMIIDAQRGAQSAR